ncbi:uncharacterized protein [Diabrotica undecimpunctata]|uniref:uncharacterized protein n=1 Tax=Diabrotica undecimpunctata TaxID=50387 RepID=UPI003B6396E7
MNIQLDIGNTYVNIICAYVSQEGCEEHEKKEFWMSLDCEMLEIPVDEKYFIKGALNGHIRTERAEIERVHGGLIMGIRNDKGNSVINFAVVWDFAVINTFFMKAERLKK